ncbi:MAG: hypothetical protein ACREUA_10280 [Burkholderiales bacterium]
MQFPGDGLGQVAGAQGLLARIAARPAVQETMKAEGLADGRVLF